MSGEDMSGTTCEQQALGRSRPNSTSCGTRARDHEERPRERLLSHGVAQLSTADLLALVLGSGTVGQPVGQLAEALLETSGGLPGLGHAPVTELCTRSGIGIARAARLVAAFELGRRALAPPNQATIGSAEDVYQLYRPRLAGLAQEVGLVIALSAKNRVVAEIEIARGEVDSIPVHPREVFRPLIRHSAVAGILIHNHPSGDPTPSQQDIQLTERLLDVAELVGIPLLDHVIIGHDGYTSVLEHL